eukprot:gnl/Spiro4/21364_TR10439_c0_g1_i1.p2 gnl/Spiro4/21364_TR10439_c0_g1~~gnl/Spiro4/21364_TR10439_c0_g1_i1.p2  ORF type:complete len:138 (+),score=34.51 gnl/Spiro4/21364_TR10439_c0_g1_i1:471-884(+)
MEGRKHDISLLRASNLLHVLSQLEFAPGQFWAVYGDQAYPKRPYLFSPFAGAMLTDDEEAFNAYMASVRLCVEWSFGNICQLWAFLDYKKNLKVLAQPLELFYKFAAILTNCNTCLYGNQTSKYFMMNPPSLQDYLA